MGTTGFGIAAVATLLALALVFTSAICTTALAEDTVLPEPQIVSGGAPSQSRLPCDRPDAEWILLGRSLRPAKEYPPIPQWLRARVAADRNMTEAVALPDGRWLLNIRTFDTRDSLRQLYVAGFDNAVTAAQLHELFSAAGKVAKVELRIEHSSTGENISASVTMASEADAQAAVATLNGTLLAGKPLYVVASPQQLVERGYEDWYLYAADGTRLANPHRPSGTDWMDRLWPEGYYEALDASGLIEYSADGRVNYTMYPGHVAIYDLTTGDVLAAYSLADGTLTYDARRDGPDPQLTAPPYRYFERLPLGVICTAYELQQKTSSSTTNP